jgi:2-keto-4-pentenoate hydratase/2-oxohepta-3-ene-1,7-dioic acid hydratase in catechol pathway
MQIVRFRDDEGDVSFGRLDAGRIHRLAGEVGSFVEAGDAAPVLLSDVRLLASTRPSKVISVGPNYHAHLQGNPPPPRPYFWIKPSSALLDPGGQVIIPAHLDEACHEAELGIVIGRETYDVTPDQARAHIFGYCCVDDVTGGNPSDPGFLTSQLFVDGKMFDTFAVIGPVIETELDTTNLRIQCRINGEIRQDHRTSDMIWRPEELVSLISRVLTLVPGDVVSTGSPPGVGPFKDGDEVEIMVEGIGSLRHGVVKRSMAQPLAAGA